MKKETNLKKKMNHGGKKKEGGYMEEGGGRGGRRRKKQLCIPPFLAHARDESFRHLNKWVGNDRTILM